MPDRNRTSDRILAEFADRDDRILISKDRDFVDWHLIQGIPGKLMMITTGNISNDQLMKLFEVYFDKIESAFQESEFIELSQTGLVIHQ